MAVQWTAARQQAFAAALDAVDAGSGATRRAQLQASGAHSRARLQAWQAVLAELLPAPVFAPWAARPAALLRALKRRLKAERRGACAQPPPPAARSGQAPARALVFVAGFFASFLLSFCLRMYRGGWLACSSQFTNLALCFARRLAARVQEFYDQQPQTAQARPLFADDGFEEEEKTKRRKKERKEERKQRRRRKENPFARTFF